MESTPPRSLAARKNRVLVLFPGALGDFICFIPALSALMETACVDLLARAEFADLAPLPVHVASLERYEIRRLFVAGARDDERVRDFFASYAAIYSWMGSQAHEFVRQMESVSRGRARFFALRPRGRTMHQQDYYLACLGVPHERPPLATIALRPRAIAWCDRFWRQHSLGGGPVLTLAPGSGAAEKNWPSQAYRTVAQWWRHRTRGAVIALFGPVEEERGGFAALSDCCATARDLDLAQAATLLARSDFYLGNDSGVTHLAAAVGARTVALFGPSDVLEWAPRGARVAVLSRNVECSPCDMTVMKSCSHRKCLTEFYPADVISELEKLLQVAALTRGMAGIRV